MIGVHLHSSATTVNSPTTTSASRHPKLLHSSSLTVSHPSERHICGARHFVLLMDDVWEQCPRHRTISHHQHVSRPYDMITREVPFDAATSLTLHRTNISLDFLLFLHFLCSMAHRQFFKHWHHAYVRRIPPWESSQRLHSRQ